MLRKIFYGLLIALPLFHFCFVAIECREIGGHVAGGLTNFHCQE